jgi:flagellar hook-associated protein 1 FlgK
MASTILSIGKSALNAAQVGLSTTGHNIANASTPGYSRQVVVQAAAQAQNFGYGFIGQGAEVTGVMRVYNEILARQMISLQVYRHWPPNLTIFPHAKPCFPMPNHWSAA